jgi:hypothetical protein
MVKKVNFSNLNTQVEFKKNEPVIYIGNSAQKTRFMNYIMLSLNILLLVGFIVLFYSLDMVGC